MTQHVQHGVQSGCLVAASATPGMVVTIGVDTPNANSIINGNVSTSLSTTSVTISAADSAQDRYDLISADSAGVVTATTGALGSIANGTAYQSDTTDVKLAYVPVVAGVTAINASDVQDVRTHVLIHTSPYRVSGLWYGPQGATSTQQQFSTADTLYGAPFFTAKSLSIQAIGVNVTTQATGSSVARLGIYGDDGGGTRTLLVDAGTTSITATGDRTISLSQTLTPGWWWLCCAVQVLTGSPFFRGVNSSGVSPIGLVDLSGTATGGRGGFAVSSVSGALPASIVSPSYATNIPIVYVQAV